MCIQKDGQPLSMCIQKDGQPHRLIHRGWGILYHKSVHIWQLYTDSCYCMHMESLVNNTVTKSNDLVEASYALRLDEQRLLLACISKIKPHTDITKYDKFKITAVEFAALYGLENKNAYKELRAATFNLYERDIRLKTANDADKRMRWVYSIEYHRKLGYVTLGFSPDVIPHMASLSNRFTSYRIKQVAGFKKVYAIRIFEMLMRWKDTGEVFISPDGLRRALSLGEKYTDWRALNQRVIKPAIAEINEKSNMKASYEIAKTGRKVTRIYFYFVQDDQQDLFKQ
jgi:plasmid replication initiation protein